MDFNSYQQAARRTALYADAYRLTYPALGLASEAGEVAGKIKKVLRDQDGRLEPPQIEAIRDELGDVLWYVAALASDLGLSLQDIASGNIEKLLSRAARGKLQGEGDRR